MIRASSIVAVATALTLLAAPSFAQSVQGAGSGSTGGTIEGKTNENSSMMKTGADNGQESVPSANPQAKTGTGDNALLNAPGESKPGSTGTSQPSSLNGQTQ